jgi:hypothetical protein
LESDTECAVGHAELFPDNFIDLERAEQEYVHEITYMECYGRFANPLRQKIYEKSMKKIIDTGLDRDEIDKMFVKAMTDVYNEASPDDKNQIMEKVISKAVSGSILSATINGDITAVIDNLDFKYIVLKIGAHHAESYVKELLREKATRIITDNMGAKYSTSLGYDAYRFGKSFHGSKYY